MPKVKIKQNKNLEFLSPYTFQNAIRKGDIITRLSIIIMGLGNIMKKQFVKGILFLASEILFIYFIFGTGIENIQKLIELGGEEQQKEWSDALGVFVYTKGDSSLLMLLYGIATIFLVIGFILFWRASVISAYKAQTIKESGKRPPNVFEDIKNLFDKDLHKLLLTLPTAGILIFTILPLVFMIAMAFTNYSKVDAHTIIFNWVGLDNFTKVLNFKDSIGGTFWAVLGWTLIWAVLATFTNYILGMMLAMVINRKGTRAKAFWRFNFILSVAIPQFVSLLIMRTIFAQNGIVNVILQQNNFISNPLPFWTSATWARIMVIVINLWIGIPFTMLQITGVLQNIPTELYEAARMDGANAFKTFVKITLPYMLFVTSPYLITTFAANVNNFNVIYLLTGGSPTPVGSTAGKTDLLVTWLYKLTIDNQYYNLGAVIGIMTFIVLAIVSLITYHNTSSYNNEEGFQ